VDTEALYRTESPHLRRWFAWKQVPWMDVDDMVQEVFARACSAGHEDSGLDQHYLWRIARNLLYDRWKKKRLRTVSLDQRADLGTVDPEPSDDTRELCRALQGLTEPQRNVVLCRWVLDMSIEQTAERLGISPLAVRARQHRAFLALRRALE